MFTIDHGAAELKIYVEEGWQEESQTLPEEDRLDMEMHLRLNINSKLGSSAATGIPIAIAQGARARSWSVTLRR